MAWSIEHLVRVEWRYAAWMFDFRICSIYTICTSGSFGNVHVSLLDLVARKEWLTNMLPSSWIWSTRPRYHCRFPASTQNTMTDWSSLCSSLANTFLWMLPNVSLKSVMDSFATALLEIFQKTIRVYLVCHLFPIFSQLEKSIGCLSVHRETCGIYITNFNIKPVPL